MRRERFHRAVLGKDLPQEYYQERDGLENQWIQQAQNLDAAGMYALSLESARQEERFISRGNHASPRERWVRPVFMPTGERRPIRLKRTFDG